MAKASTGRPECFSSTFTEILFVSAVTMCFAMTSWLAGGIAVMVSKLGADLHMNNAQITWAEAASSLSGGAFLLFFGRVADLFGRKQMMVGSLFLFAAFCLGSGFAPNGITLDVTQGFLGLWAASATPAAVGALGSVYPKPSKRKNYAFACLSAANPLGFVAGSIAAGITTQIFSWRAFFFFLAIVYLFFTICAIFVVPRDTDKKQPLSWQTLRTFDIGGTVLVIGGIGLLSTSLTLAGSAPDGWSTGYVIALLVIGLALIACFLYYETLVPDPLIPMWTWKDRDFSLLLLILFIGYGGFTSVCFWATLYIQRYWTSSTLLVAAYILPLAVMGTFVNVVAGAVLHKLSNKLMMAIGAAAFTVAFLLISFHRTGDKYWCFFFPAFCICVWGADFQFNVVNMYVMTSLPAKQQSTGSGIFQTVTRLSNVITLGITTAIFNAVQQHPPTTGYVANDPIAPYSATFYYSTAICFVSILLCPFLRIGTQGGDTALDTEAAVTAATPEAVMTKGMEGKVDETVVSSLEK